MARVIGRPQNRTMRALIACLMLVAGPVAGQCRVVTVQLFGDSTQVGYDGRSLRPLADGPARLLQAAMDRRFGARSVRVELRGVGGTASGDLLAGTDGLNRPWPRSATADITVLNHGLNDMQRRVPIEAYQRNLAAMRVTLYETPNPVAPRMPWASTAYAEAMRRVAGGAPLADVDAFVRSLPEWSSYLPDGVHPSEALYRLIVANVLFPALEPLVAKARGC